MVSALGQAGNAPKGVVVKLGEGHGFIKTENSVELYDKIYEFLAEQIGSGRAR